MKSPSIRALFACVLRLHRNCRRLFVTPLLYFSLLSVALFVPGFMLKVIQVVDTDCLDGSSLYMLPFVIYALAASLWICIFPIALLTMIILYWLRKQDAELDVPQHTSLIKRSAHSLSVFLATVAIAIFFAYLWWPVFTVDDGPFFAEPYLGDVTDLRSYSHVSLDRFSDSPYVLEVRLTEGPNPESVFILRNNSAGIVWQLVPKHPGPLGAIQLNPKYTRLAWWGGWVVSIKPEFQESGELYVGPLGGFRYFYHSW